MQVDEDTKEDVEVENMDMLAGCAVGVEATDEAEGALGDKSSAEKKKSVRVVVEHGEAWQWCNTTPSETPEHIYCLT